MQIKLKILFILATLAVFLCGCQQSPDSRSVVSKNDGTFDVNVIKSATEATTVTDVFTENSNTPGKKGEIEFPLKICDEFSSTDGSVIFSFNINQKILNVPMPVVEVAPHFISEADAQRVAYALFGNADFFEAEPRFSETFSQGEIRDKLERWAPYGGDDGIIDSYIQEYTKLMETAPTDTPHSMCEWNFKKSTFYNETFENAVTLDTSGDNDEIRATVRVGKVPYALNFATRNKSDFKLNNIFVQPFDGLSPQNIDSKIFRTMLCKTEAPDEKTIEMVKKKAIEMLAKMELGDWVIDDCYAAQDENGSEQYSIHISAVPLLNGVPAFRRPQLTNLKSKEIYASNYYLTDAQFQFNANGDLVFFEMYSPVDIVEIVNENTQVLSLDELYNLAKNYFSLSDSYQYDYMWFLDGSTEEMKCSVNISEIDYGLTRVKVPNTSETYYYVPAMSFYGSIEFEGKQSGNVYDVGENTGKLFPLLTINAVDGSVIHTENE